MKTLNRVQLIGLLGDDPKIYAMPSGTLVARFSLATQQVYKEKSANIIKKITDWHAIAVTGYLAENAERFLQKGTCVYVEGSLKKREYEDKEKITRQITEIIGDDMIILHNGKEQPITTTFNFKKIKQTESLEGNHETQSKNP